MITYSLYSNHLTRGATEISNFSEFKLFSFGDYLLCIHGESKFVDDCITIDCEDYFFFLEGIVLNKKSLSKNYDSWESFVNSQISMTSEQLLWDKFNGSFSGLYFCKKSQVLMSFNDHIGSKAVYFYLKDNDFILSNKISLLRTILNSQFNRKLKIEDESAYSLLSYGFTLEGKTLFQNVAKLSPGSYLKRDFNSLTESSYFRFCNNPDPSISFRDAIDIVDEYFTTAVRLQFEKDKEYGYAHLVGLSGGLDSRMVTMVANELGYIDQTNFTFSQSDYLDESIAKKIASDLQHEWIFKFLDNGSFLKNLDEVTNISGGEVLYYGLSHGLSIYSLLNFEKFGLLHTGQLGDVALGTYYSSDDFDKRIASGDGAFSKTFSDKVNIDINKYPNQELFNFYNRGFSGINCGLKPIQEKTETFSPFYEKNFLEACLKIPPEIRFGHNLYKEWIKARHPNAANYIWEKTGEKIAAKTICFKGKRFTISQFFNILFYKTTGYQYRGVDSKRHMNPYEYWLRKNRSLSKYIDDYYNENISLFQDGELKSDIAALFDNGSALNKLQVASLLSAKKVFE
ncbi:asparagine synthase-related protein [Motilimonas eburnea]|uniref:asparagine synthase-related protein n=1 Tax=Motilimonas eburnea TaxID=1737488 RepID=UPI001E629BE8|nr:asparagine synthase-related protein [Motilimonas eburnea]MCE2572591.1 hypothetical protein [Motilimonas eburnea]